MIDKINRLEMDVLMRTLPGCGHLAMSSILARSMMRLEEVIQERSMATRRIAERQSRYIGKTGWY